MTLGQNESVVSWMFGLLDVILHDVEEENRHDLGHGGTRRGVSRLGDIGGGDGVNTELVCEVLQLLKPKTTNQQLHQLDDPNGKRKGKLLAGGLKEQRYRTPSTVTHSPAKFWTPICGSWTW